MANMWGRTLIVGILTLLPVPLVLTALVSPSAGRSGVDYTGRTVPPSKGFPTLTDLIEIRGVQFEFSSLPFRVH